MGRVLLSWLLLSGSVMAGAAETATEPSSGTRFDLKLVSGDTVFQLVGTGARKGSQGPLYAMALYVEESDARRAFPALVARAGGREHVRLVAGDHAQSFVLWGHFSKQAVLHFLRSVDAPELRRELREGLEAELLDKSSNVLRRDVERFLRGFDSDLKEGEEIRIRTDDAGHIEVQVETDRVDAPTSPKLARAIWSIWLGARTPAPELRHGLVDRIDVVGR